MNPISTIKAAAGRIWRDTWEFDRQTPSEDKQRALNELKANIAICNWLLFYPVEPRVKVVTSVEIFGKKSRRDIYVEKDNGSVAVASCGYNYHTFGGPLLKYQFNLRRTPKHKWPPREEIKRTIDRMAEFGAALVFADNETRVYRGIKVKEHEINLLPIFGEAEEVPSITELLRW